MHRKTKTGSGIYQYLEAAGLLQQGTVSEIENAKKMYWQERRKILKKQFRNEHTCYTLFFTKKESQIILKAMNKKKGIAEFIKQNSLHAISQSTYTDKQTIGEIRALLFQFYNFLQTEHCKSQPVLISKFLSLEQQILQMLLK